mgnify:CR=1 FL=1
MDNEENYVKIKWDEIKKGMYIIYHNKAFVRQTKQKVKPKWNYGGYVTFIESSFIGLKNKYGKMWSIQKENVDVIMITVNDYVKFMSEKIN